MPEKKTLSWRDVLYSNAPAAPLWGRRCVFERAARFLGYRYIEWKGRVYMLTKGEYPYWQDTGLTVDDLETGAVLPKAS